MHSKKTLHIAVAAGKGGVGKSTVTAYLARAFATAHKKVGVFDADVYGPSLRHMLPEDLLPKWDNHQLIPAKCGDISLISPSFFQGAEGGFSVRAPMANKLIKQFCEQTDFSDRDLILYDFPPGTGDVQLTLCQEVIFSGALLVTTPQELVQADVRKAHHLFHQMKVPVLGLVENMSYFVEPLRKSHLYPFGQGGGQKLAHQLGLPFLGTLPLDPEISLRADQGRGLEGEAKAAFDQLATLILKKVSELKAPVHLIDVQVEECGVTLCLSDGAIIKCLAEDLQKRCPCASCKVEMKVEKNVKVVQVMSVGRYALRFQFSSGCSKGLFELNQLRSD